MQFVTDVLRLVGRVLLVLTMVLVSRRKFSALTLRVTPGLAVAETSQRAVLGS